MMADLSVPEKATVPESMDAVPFLIQLPFRVNVLDPSVNVASVPTTRWWAVAAAPMVGALPGEA